MRYDAIGLTWQRLCIGLMAVTGACTHWVPGPVELSSIPAGSKVRATLISGEQVIIRSATLAGDTIISTTPGGVQWAPPRIDRGVVVEPTDGSNRGVLLSRIARLEIKKLDGTATSLVAFGGMALAAVVIAEATNDDPEVHPDAVVNR